MDIRSTVATLKAWCLEPFVSDVFAWTSSSTCHLHSIYAFLCILNAATIPLPTLHSASCLRIHSCIFSSSKTMSYLIKTLNIQLLPPPPPSSIPPNTLARRKKTPTQCRPIMPTAPSNIHTSIDPYIYNAMHDASSNHTILENRRKPKVNRSKR